MTSFAFTNSQLGATVSVSNNALYTDVSGIIFSDNSQLFSATGLARSGNNISLFINDSGYIRSISEDLTPKLGGSLNLNTYSITGIGNISANTGSYTSLNINSTGVSISGHKHISTDITDFNEAVDDRVSNLLVAGTGISLNYDDNSNALTINLSSSSIKGYEILTSNKSVFTVTQGYLVNNLNVYINGVKLLDGVDYTATNGSTFTLTETAVSGNIVEWNGLGGATSYVTNISGSGNIVATNNNGSFTISSSGLIKSDTTSIIGASGVTNIVVMSKTDYDSIVTKNPTTLYYIV